MANIVIHACLYKDRLKINQRLEWKLKYYCWLTVCELNKKSKNPAKRHWQNIL